MEEEAGSLGLYHTFFRESRLREHLKHPGRRGPRGDPSLPPGSGAGNKPGLARGLGFWGPQLLWGPRAPGRKGSRRGGQGAGEPRGRRGLEAGSARPGSFCPGVLGDRTAPARRAGSRGRPARGLSSSRPSASRLTPVSGLLPGPVHHRRSRRRLSPGLPGRLQHAPGHVSVSLSVRHLT